MKMSIIHTKVKKISMPDTFVSSTHVITTPHWCLNPNFGQNLEIQIYQAIEELTNVS